MNKTELLDKIRTERADWEALLVQVGQDRLTQPGVEGDWSVRDIIAHIAAYEDWTADQLITGTAPSAAEFQEMEEAGPMDTDRRNAIMHEQTRDLPLPDVLAQSEQAYRKLLGAVEALPDEALEQPQWWTGDDPLWKAIPSQCSDHYQQHVPSILVWIDNQPFSN